MYVHQGYSPTVFIVFVDVVIVSLTGFHISVILASQKELRGTPSVSLLLDSFKRIACRYLLKTW